MTQQVDPEVAAALEALPLTRLVHVTPALALPSILIDGELRSTSDLKDDARGSYRAIDRDRLDGQLSKISCSFQYPNSYYLRRARHKLSIHNFPDWVCLLLDKSVAAHAGTLFCHRNAAAKGARPIAGVEGLRACFAAEVRGHRGRTYTRGRLHDPASPTDIQAEVLVTAPIALSAVHAIVFKTEADARQEYGRLDQLGVSLPDHLRWMVAEGMFKWPRVKAAVQTSKFFPMNDWSPVPRRIGAA